jgi:NADH-quinone oxidoreductase subunit J
MMSNLFDGGIFWMMAAVAVAGALWVVLTRDVLRMVLGLGAFLLAIGGFFAYYGFGFLALAQLFLYVGGVLVLFLFAIMLVHRAHGGTPALENRVDPLLIASSGVLACMLFVMLRPLSVQMSPGPGGGSPSQLAGVLLGDMLPQFEAVGVLLLVALVAVVVVMAGDRR